MESVSFLLNYWIFVLTPILIFFFLLVCRSDDVDVMISEAEYEKVQAGLKEMLSAICDYAHDRCVKVMSARAKVVAIFFLL